MCERESFQLGVGSGTTQLSILAQFGSFQCKNGPQT
jgi:hypothetical protein